MAIPFIAPAVVFLFAVAVAAAFFLATAFLAVDFVGTFFATGALFAADFGGIGIFMPGVFICATAGADTEASASALAANNRLSFTGGDLQREAPHSNGASGTRFLQPLAGMAFVLHVAVMHHGHHVLAALATFSHLLLTHPHVTHVAHAVHGSLVLHLLVLGRH